MNKLMVCIYISVLSESKLSTSLLFDANHLELDLLLTKLDRLSDAGYDNKTIRVEKLSLDGVHVARCLSIDNLSDLKTLLRQIHEFANQDFIRLNRAIGAFDISSISPSEILHSVDKIAPTAYYVHDNFKDKIDIRDKGNFKYIEVGKGILIGTPLSK